jgi:hypothetical protein
MIVKGIDHRGGRGALVLSNPVLAAGLGLLAVARGPAGLASAWMLLWTGMALGLYDSAFATLTALYGLESAITDHRHHVDRRLCQYRRPARVGIAQPAFRVAKRMPRLGGSQSPCLPADEPAADPATR